MKVDGGICQPLAGEEGTRAVLRIDYSVVGIGPFVCRQASDPLGAAILPREIPDRVILDLTEWEPTNDANIRATTC